MRNKDLVAMLQQLDPEMEVCTFSDIGAMLVDYKVGVYRGMYEDGDNIKAILAKREGMFIGLGNPEDCECIDEYEIVDNKYSLVYNQITDDYGNAVIALSKETFRD